MCEGVFGVAGSAGVGALLSWGSSEWESVESGVYGVEGLQGWRFISVGGSVGCSACRVRIVLSSSLEQGRWMACGQVEKRGPRSRGSLRGRGSPRGRGSRRQEGKWSQGLWSSG